MFAVRYAVMIAVVCAITAGSVYAVELRLDRAAECDNGLAVPAPEANPGLVADCEALMAARDSLRGSGELDWAFDRSILQWTGVLVQDDPLRVVGLRLTSRRLDGVVPAELGKVERLRYLNLRSNLLTGPLPPDLGQLAELESLQLQWNNLHGPIPPALGQLGRLAVLNLRSNGLSGPIPSALGQLTGLRNLLLDKNRLAGRIPPPLGDLPNLEFLRLRENGFTGCVPASLAGIADNDVDQLGLPPCDGP